MEKNIPVTRSALPPLEEYMEEIRPLWESRWLTNMGEKHRELERLLREFLDADHIELVSNGHMALELSLQALKLTGEVITTPYTFASTTHAIVRNNLTPVFCDIRKDDFTIDADMIESLITEKTCAIVPVHVYGNLCDVEKIERIAGRHGLKVIYDAAHSFGESYKGKNVSAFGDVSCFSFHATKVFNTIEGGAVCFRNEELGKSIYQLKNFGIKDEETVDGIGANAKMNEFCAAMGICNLRHVKEAIEQRRKLTECYREHLEGKAGIQLNPVQKDVESNYAYFPVVFHEKECGVTRNEMEKKLVAQGIHPRKYFYPITSAFDCFRDRFDPLQTPNALYTSKHILTLPLYPEMTPEDVDRICRVITG